MKKALLVTLFTLFIWQPSVHAASRALTADEEIQLRNDVVTLCGDTACEGDVEFQFLRPDCRWQERSVEKSISCTMYARLIFRGSSFLTSCTVAPFRNKEEVLKSGENSFAVKAMDCFSDKASYLQKAVIVRELQLPQMLFCKSPSLGSLTFKDFNTLLPSMIGMDAHFVSSTVNPKKFVLGFSNERDNSYEFTFDTSELKNYSAGNAPSVKGTLQYTIPNMPEGSGGQITEEVMCAK